jgi:lactoylglutathione lyase
MRTLQFGLKVGDPDTALEFYTTLGYEIVGAVPDAPIGHLTMLKLPDDEFVTLELVHDVTGDASAPGFSHFAIQVASLDDTLAHLTDAGLRSDAIASPAPGMRTCNVTDPDGRTIELVQWPADHAAGMTAADFPDQETSS